ncbi:MAG: hypothetical protein ACLSVD_10035 [Eggerthellaceae bacterium]
MFGGQGRDRAATKLSCFRNRTFAIATVLVMMSQMAFMVGSIMVPLVQTQGGSATVWG